MESGVIASARVSPRRRRRIFSVAMAFIVLITIALAAMLNGCGGSSSTISSPPPPVTKPTVVNGPIINCTSDFFSDATIHATCYSATLEGCPNTSNLTFTYSYDAPASPKGTIVFFSGGAGTGDAGDVGDAGYYFSQGYEVIQIVWAYDWEVTNSPAQYTGNGSTTNYAANIQVAACRQATFLNFVFNTNNTSLYSAGGRCAQGSSAGSAAIAYALTYYGAGNYLDAVELKSGPPLADIEQGCEEPPAADVTLCGNNQVGCELGGTLPWTLSPTYTGAASGVRTWTNDNSCAVPGSTTSSSSNTAWQQQSIVDGGANNPVYSYPHTAMTAWLCQTIYQPPGQPCVGGNQYGQGGSPQDSCPNNAASQGQIYYAQLTSNPNSLPQAPYHIYAVLNCDGPEGVDGPDTAVPALSNANGDTAIQNDMLTQCTAH